MKTRRDPKIKIQRERTIRECDRRIASKKQGDRGREIQRQREIG